MSWAETTAFGYPPRPLVGASTRHALWKSAGGCLRKQRPRSTIVHIGYLGTRDIIRVTRTHPSSDPSQDVSGSSVVARSKSRFDRVMWPMWRITSSTLNRLWRTFGRRCAQRAGDSRRISPHGASPGRGKAELKHAPNIGVLVTFREVGKPPPSLAIESLRWGAPSIIVMSNLYLWIAIASTVLLINVVAFAVFLRW